jgi:hypothetical protein
LKSEYNHKCILHSEGTYTIEGTYIIGGTMVLRSILIPKGHCISKGIMILRTLLIPKEQKRRGRSDSKMHREEKGRREKEFSTTQ